MATLSNVLEFARAQAQTDINGLTDAKGIIFANEALRDFHRRLTDKGVDASQLQESYTSGVAGQGTYLYPTNAIFLKTIELNYTNSNGADYITATQVDVSNIPGNQSFSQLRVNAPTNAPYWDDRGDWFEIFPTPTGGGNLTNMMRIFYYLRPTEYTSVADTIAYPESLDFTILGWRVVANYLMSLGKGQEANLFYMKYEERVKQYTETLSRGSQQPIQATPLQISGWQF